VDSFEGALLAGIHVFQPDPGRTDLERRGVGQQLDVLAEEALVEQGLEGDVDIFADRPEAGHDGDLLALGRQEVGRAGAALVAIVVEDDAALTNLALTTKDVVDREDVWE